MRAGVGHGQNTRASMLEFANHDHEKEYAENSEKDVQVLILEFVLLVLIFMLIPLASEMS